MATAASKSTSKTAAKKKTAGAKKTASRTRKSPAKKTAVADELAVHAALLTLQQRLETLEGKLSQGLTALVAEVKDLRLPLRSIRLNPAWPRKRLAPSCKRRCRSILRSS